MPLCEALAAAAAQYPDRVAIVDGSTRVTYAGLYDEAAQFSTMIKRMGVREGERVALVLPNSRLYVAALLGTLRAGAIAVPMNPLMTRDEVVNQLADAGVGAVFVHESAAAIAGVGDGPDEVRESFGADAVFVREGPAEAIPWAADRPDHEHACGEADQTAVILYTSGSTMEPKGVEITHGNLDAAGAGHHNPFGLDENSPDTFLGAVPLAHALGLASVILPWLSCAGTLVTMRKFDAAAALELIHNEHVSFVTVVPTMLARFVDVGARAPVRVVVAGAAALPDSLTAPTQDVFGVPAVVGYGMSETTGPISFTGLSEPSPDGSVGRPIEGLEVRAVNADGAIVPAGTPAAGELQVRGPSVSAGYWRRSEATARSRDHGWFRTGDVGRQDVHGNLYLTGRLKDLISRGGYNVHPGEVEAVLLRHTAVSAAAVVGRDHPTLGQTVHAFVVLEPNRSVTAEELQSFIAGRLAAYKVPRHVTFLAEMPTNHLGKVVKAQLP